MNAVFSFSLSLFPGLLLPPCLLRHERVACLSEVSSFLSAISRLDQLYRSNI